MPDHDTNEFQPRLSPKGQILYNLPARARLEHPNVPMTVLCSGSVLSTKTWSVATLVMRHLWETPAARFVIFSTAVKTLSDAGPWRNIMEDILPEWTHPETGIGMRILTKSRQGVYGGIVDSKTRTILMKVSNYYGGESEIQLNSIQHEEEVDAKMLSTTYTGVWFSELKLWKSRHIFDVSLNRLRAGWIEQWQHLWIADTNPPKEGTKSWIYPLWFSKDIPIPAHLVGDISPEVAAEVKRSRILMEWTMDDNPFMSEETKQAKKLQLSDDPLVYKRDALGEWVAGGGGSTFLFAHIFSRNKHVIGVKDKDDPGRGQIKLSPDTDHLYSSWDLGGGANHAAGIVEQRIVITPEPVGPISVFSVLASVRALGEDIKVQDFTLRFMASKEALEKRYPDRNFDWTDYSDDSAINQPRGAGSGFDYLEVMIASKNTINLIGVSEAKKKNMVGVRIRLIRRLLREGRLYVSADCEDVIDMLEEAKETKDEEFEWGPHKHVFDWLSYVLYMLCFDEVEELSRGPQSASEGTTISVPL